MASAASFTVSPFTLMAQRGWDGPALRVATKLTHDPEKECNAPDVHWKRLRCEKDARVWESDRRPSFCEGCDWHFVNRSMAWYDEPYRQTDGRRCYSACARCRREQGLRDLPVEWFA